MEVVRVEQQYALYYKNTRIGTLRVDATGKRHCYEPDAAGVAAVEPNAFLLREMKEGTGGFVEQIPFFESRLRNMKRWGLTRLNYQTDYFTLVLLE
jgi:hypothetical protein